MVSIFLKLKLYEKNLFRIFGTNPYRDNFFLIDRYSSKKMCIRIAKRKTKTVLSSNSPNRYCMCLSNNVFAMKTLFYDRVTYIVDGLEENSYSIIDLYLRSKMACAERCFDMSIFRKNYALTNYFMQYFLLGNRRLGDTLKAGFRLFFTFMLHSGDNSLYDYVMKNENIRKEYLDFDHHLDKRGTVSVYNRKYIKLEEIEDHPDYEKFLES